MTVTLTHAAAQIERRRILDDVRFHRNAAKRRLRDLERLEADCARVGIRLIRQPVRAQESRDSHATRSTAD
jgi:hypothetical protein